jgi:Na+-translocating ferredoxin:NAD+ oxidoreductase RNF subunit RnfB
MALLKEENQEGQESRVQMALLKEENQENQESRMQMALLREENQEGQESRVQIAMFDALGESPEALHTMTTPHQCQPLRALQHVKWVNMPLQTEDDQESQMHMAPIDTLGEHPEARIVLYLRQPLWALRHVK